jgi:hypothetical protein
MPDVVTPQFIQSPDKRIMDHLTLDPRIKYHPMAASVNYSAAVHTAEELLGEGSVSRHQRVGLTYGFFAFDQLVDRIRTEYEDHLPVRLRGTVLNIGPEIRGNGFVVKDIYAVLRDGTERDDRSHVPQTPFDVDAVRIHHRTTQWAVQSAQELRARVPEALKQNLFPAIVVYDHKRFAPTSSALPDSKFERNKVILGAYLLDYVDIELVQ